MIERKRVWVCLVRNRAYDNPTHTLEFFCMNEIGGASVMKKKHEEAGCGAYEKVN